MKEIRLNKVHLHQIGNVRVTKELFDKVQKLAKEHGVSSQEIVRAILESYIDEVRFT